MTRVLWWGLLAVVLAGVSGWYGYFWGYAQGHRVGVGLAVCEAIKQHRALEGLPPLPRLADCADVARRDWLQILRETR